MPGKPRLHFQLTESSCVPACLRMVFGAYGRDVSEFDLRLACRTGDDGTSPEAAAAAAVAYGFADSFTDYLTVDQLIDELSRGLFPIVFIELSEGVVCPHAVVVLEVVGTEGGGEVRYLDPELGEQERPLTEFARMWSRANGRAVVVDPGPGLDEPAGPESDAGAAEERRRQEERLSLKNM